MIVPALAIAGAVAVYATRGRGSTLLAPSICRGPKDEASVALTFDDGPSESTPSLLEILDKHRVRATFFQCGANAQRLPERAREVSQAGHEIGNHTQNHAPLWLKSPSFLRGELSQAQATLTRLHGYAPTLFRAPYGVRWIGLRGAQQELNLMGVMWTTIGRDWSLPAARIAARLVRGLRNGAIFCLHDARELAPNPEIRQTIRAVDDFIPVALDRGFRFKTVTSLCLKSSSNA
jgi:peptidoglycan/xylan/chitin deacetylase (PgdA/CDA1 family)